MDFPGMSPGRWLTDQNIGMCRSPHEFLHPFFDMHSNYYRPWKWDNQSVSKEFGSTIENEKGNYKITLDVQYYRPSEINVKVSDNEIIVEGKHEERPDTHGFISRQFRRRYPLPSHCSSDNVTSTLTSDGILTVIAEKEPSKETEKIVPIKMCGTCPRKTQMENKITKEISQKTQKENTKDSDICTEIQDMSKTKNHIMKEDHSRLLKPEFLKETESNGTCSSKAVTKQSKEYIDIMKTTAKSDPLDISSTSNKIEESLEKTILGLTALTEQLGQSSLASTSEACSKKSSDIMCGIKNVSEMCDLKKTSEISDMRNTSESVRKATSESAMKSTPEIAMKATSESAMKGTSESAMKATSESAMKATSESAMKGTSESTMKATSESAMKATSESAMKAISESAMKAISESTMKAMSKTLIEESSSSYKSSSSSMSSTMKMGGKTGGNLSDTISQELREAAENV